MAEKDDKGKDKDKGDDKKKKGGGKDLPVFIAFFIILYIIWSLSGGPNRNTSSRNNQFMNSMGLGQGNGETYHDAILGQPGSVTNTLPFLK